MKRLLILAILSSGCSATFRTVGSHDPVVDVVQAMALQQTTTLQALTLALTRAQALSCPVEVVR